MEAIILQGRVYKLGETEEKGEKKFKVREMILECDYDAQYPAFLTVQGTGDKCDKMDDLVPGAIVTMHVNLQGRIYKTKDGEEKSFNSISIWKFEINQSETVLSNSDDVEDQYPPF